jgi:hypothetical protein
MVFRMSRQTKATDDRVNAVVQSIAIGMSLEQACAHNGICSSTWHKWAKNPSFHEARDRAIAARIEWLVHQLERATTKVQVNKWSWFLERTRAYGGIFTDSATGSRTNVSVNTIAEAHGQPQLGPGQIRVWTEDDLEQARQTIDKVRKRQAARLLDRKESKAGNGDSLPDEEPEPE